MTNPAKPAPDANGGRESRRANPLSLILGSSVYIAIAALVAWNTDRGRQFLEANWPWLAGAVAILVVVALIPQVRSRLHSAAPRRRAALIIFVIIPVILAVIGGAAYLLEGVSLTKFLRIMFLLVVCLLPAFMYYLFVVTRRYSLLNEFLTNLNRLGLLKLHREETASSLRRRLLSYVQKFQAIYGPLPPRWVAGFLERPEAFFMEEEVSEEGKTFESIFSTETTIPVLFATVLIALGWIMTLPPALTEASANAAEGGWPWPDALVPTETPVHFAFLGAYFFSLQLLFRRYVRRDLGASTYVSFAMRIVLAVIGTWVVLQWLKAGGGLGAITIPEPSHRAYLVIAFVIGAFPRIVWQMVLAVGTKVFRYVISGLQTALPVTDLDGLNIWHEARLEEEDIESIPSMASADMVELLINTRFPANRLVDWVDQAILYSHLGPGAKEARDALRRHGIVSATTMLQVYGSSDDAEDRRSVEAILAGEGRSTLRSLADAVQISPNLDLVKRWKRFMPQGDRRFEE